MPVYEYHCEKCVKTLDIYKQINDDTKQKCPTCGTEMKKLISAPSRFDLRGAGFHVNDYPKGDK